MTNSESRHISERAEHINSVRFSFEQRAEIESVLEWLFDFPDEAAAYIVWLEEQVT